MTGGNGLSKDKLQGKFVDTGHFILFLDRNYAESDLLRSLRILQLPKDLFKWDDFCNCKGKK